MSKSFERSITAILDNADKQKYKVQEPDEIEYEEEEVKQGVEACIEDIKDLFLDLKESKMYFSEIKIQYKEEIKTPIEFLEEIMKLTCQALRTADKQRKAELKW